MLKFIRKYKRNLESIMNKKQRKIIAWIMLVIMIASVIASILAYAL